MSDNMLLLLFITAIAIVLIWLSPWLLLPVAGSIVASASSRLPEHMRDPLRRLGWLTAYSTLPVGIAGLVLPIAKLVLPPNYFLWLMLRTYDLHHWTDDQVWLKPVVLAPLLGVAGIVSIILGRPRIIARLGRLAEFTGQTALCLYVLSLFSFVTPGPFELQLNKATQAMRDRLNVSLQLQRNAEEEYLANMVVMVVLKDNVAEGRSHLANMARDAGTAARRLGCERVDAHAGKCGELLNVKTAFGQALPNLGASPNSPDRQRGSDARISGSARSRNPRVCRR